MTDTVRLAAGAPVVETVTASFDDFFASVAESLSLPLNFPPLIARLSVFFTDFLPTL